MVAAMLAFAGCTPGRTPAANDRHLQPLSESMLAELEAKGMEKESPILMRIFKEEAKLEVWKQARSGRFALLRTYPICRWSGQLGPKIKQGDRQAPEGFYTITPGLLNPNSNYYLAINTGFPNASDRANGYTGAFLMIHGDCSSSGCYAVRDKQRRDDIESSELINRGTPAAPITTGVDGGVSNLPCSGEISRRRWRNDPHQLRYNSRKR
jgi:murein L,D-transpeptidase YafK